jgi:hypothetical protein
MARAGFDLSEAILPSAPAIRGHLRPTISLMRRTEAGIELTSRSTMPGSSLGATAPVGAALLLPAVASARQAARRAQSMNNIKQLAIAMLNYENSHNSFPPAYSSDKQGKPLLSWRVAVLPYIAGKDLYDQFHLDEPWDSEHNKQLVARMPREFRSPVSSAAPGMTNYLTVRGKDTAFPGKDGVKPAQITDGMSNTIMLVEVGDARAVPWTKPDDFEYDEKNPKAGLLGLYPGGFNAVFCDGAARFLSSTIDSDMLKRLFLRNDGEPIDQGRLNAR